MPPDSFRIYDQKSEEYRDILLNNNGDGTHSLPGGMISRSASLDHRSAIVSADKVSDIGVITLSGQSIGGSLAFGTTYYVSAVIRNPQGNTKFATVVSASPGGANNGLRAAFSVPTGALDTDIIEFFLSVDAAPKHVCTCTVAQFKTGGIVIAENGAVGVGGAANSLDIGVVGTGIQTSNAIFAQSNAYLVPNGITPIDCSGKTRAHVDVSVAITDLRSAPSASIIPYFLNNTDWYVGQREPLNLLNALGQPMYQTFDINVNGASGMILLITDISGQGTAVTIKVRLS